MAAITYKQEVFRKTIHLSSLWMPAAMYFLPVYSASALFLILFIGNVLVEYGYYKQWPIIHPMYNMLFGKMLRNERGEGRFELSGSPYVLASAFLTVILFKPEIAVFAFSAMLIGDTAAALIGRKFGRTKLASGKSLEGFLSFLISSGAVLAVCGIMFDFTSAVYIRGAIGITGAGIAELYGKTIKIDDNFSIPLIIGVITSWFPV